MRFVGDGDGSALIASVWANRFRYRMPGSLPQPCVTDALGSLTTAVTLPVSPGWRLFRKH